MRKLGFALVVLLACSLPVYADAIPLEITSGYLNSSSPSLWDWAMQVDGEGFHLYSTGDHFTGRFSSATFTVPSIVLVALTTGGVTYQPYPVEGGLLTFTHARALVLPNFNDIPPGMTFTDQTTFTMTAHFNVGGGFDFAGQGIVVGSACSFCSKPEALSYTFTPVSVPEPESVVLLGVGLVGLMLWGRMQRWMSWMKRAR